MERRDFLMKSSIVTIGFLGLRQWSLASNIENSYSLNEFGKLIPDPKGILDLPEGFSYKIISTYGEKMTDGFLLPGSPDGMAAFPLDEDRCIVVRNHELSPTDFSKQGPFGSSNELLPLLKQIQLYDYGKGEKPSVGGTTNFIFNLKEQKIEKQFLSLVGTNRNCAGGATPWGTWLTCEEDVTTRDNKTVEKNHGYVFEVPANPNQILTSPIPLKAMGRFNHEAVCVNPNTGIVYLTEDRNDGLLYRFIPNEFGQLKKGGKLQFLSVQNKDKFDTRNWNAPNIKIGEALEVFWTDIDIVDSNEDDLRLRCYENGAALFARGEGAWFGDNEFYFACTSGGKQKHGQLFKYNLSPFEGEDQESLNPATIELFVEPDNADLMTSCDNLTIAPWGDVMLCEDTLNSRITGVTKEGRLYPFARNVGYSSEMTGVCFSPDGSTMFVNIQHAGLTFAITGPWKK